MSRPTPPSEPEVGITEFVAPSVPGFMGRFKDRWQDFHVHEVDAAGTVLHLSELITPGAVAAELRQAREARQDAFAALGPGFCFEGDAARELVEALGEAPAAQLLAFLRQQSSEAGAGRRRRAEVAAALAASEALAEPGPAAEAEGDEGDEADGDVEPPAAEAPAAKEAPPGFVDFDSSAIGDGSKQARTRAHQTVTKHLTEFLTSETIEGDGGKRTIRIWMREAERKAKSFTLACEQRSQDEQSKGGKGKGKGKGKDKGKSKGKKGKGKAGKNGCDVVEPVQSFGTLRREGWPQDRPDYLYFRLYKENCDTGEAVKRIAECVGRSPKQFTFAGTKDKRGVTVQSICAHRLPADQLRRTLTHRMWDKRLRISDMEYRPDRLRLGMLKGNLFHIALRGVPPDAIVPKDGSSDTVVDRAFGAVRDAGFLNYFGLQRFGTRQVGTHRVGAAVIAGRWEEAVRLVLGDTGGGGASSSTASPPTKRPLPEGDAAAPPTKAAKPSEGASVAEQRAGGGGGDEEMREVPAEAPDENAPFERRPRGEVVAEAARLFLEHGDAKAALNAMPRSEHIARCLLGGLVRGLAPVEALKQLPHQALSLYAHAAQSAVWNAMLSHRVREHGPRAAVGDFVLAAPTAAVQAVPADFADEGLADIDAEAEDGETEDLAPERFPELPAVRTLQTAEEAAATSWSDVVLPLPGSDVQYPPELRPHYERIAREKLGLSLEDFHGSSLVPLAGSYRSVAVKASDLHWRLVPPAEAANAYLQDSDVARLLGQRDAAANGGEAVAPAAVHPAPSRRGESEGGEHAAVVFSCLLPPSAYLTMLLREVMKQSTGAEHVGMPSAVTA